ncbi:MULTISPECIES: hypothetical protein [unclassified Burkholderia]|uniref:hypothetical protein n=1 Tax=unclassified Burkholderia TaxID=2613784 RepID=UPI000F566CC7|nr:MULTISPECIES: hypothetical protein [unclassified Burkholderia]RQR87631.1 hypothetical protein DIE10_05940 [Burkholderia sp. Bp9011]RQR96978.1 hypothetical protein DIE09_06125 [Burkholderia sp. Bp9010]RQS80684.1 hypothetical protein DID97_05605 [Burkholderia sp. Bp8977]
MKNHPWFLDNPVGDPFGGPAYGRYEDMGSLIGAGVSLVGGMMGSDAAGDAAQPQADAANRAADMQQKQFEETQRNLRPYMDLGSAAISPLLQAMGYKVSSGAPVETRDQIYQRFLPQYTKTSMLTPGESSSGSNPFSVFRGAAGGSGSGQAQTTIDYNGLNAAVDDAMQRQRAASYGNWTVDPSNILQQKFSYADFKAPTAAEAAATPGYQFALQQGLKAAQNSASARGLGASGAALKGAESFATGLADSTYGDTFNRALSAYSANRNNAASNFATNYASAGDRVNRLLGLVGNGQNAAAQTGALGAQTANSVGNAVMSGAAAQAAGAVGSANAINSGISGAINSIQSGMMLNKLFPTAGAGTGGSTLYGAPSASNPTGYNVGGNSYGFTV